MKSEIKVSYALVGADLDPKRVTLVAGIAPSETWLVGDSRLPKLPKLRARESGWSVTSAMSLSTELEEQVVSILDRLQPAWQVLCQLGVQYDAVISCVVKTYGGDRPSIHFDRDTLKRIAELNATVDVDLYVFH